MPSSDVNSPDTAASVLRMTLTAELARGAGTHSPAQCTCGYGCACFAEDVAPAAQLQGCIYCCSPME